MLFGQIFNFATLLSPILSTCYCVKFQYLKKELGTKQKIQTRHLVLKPKSRHNKPKPKLKTKTAPTVFGLILVLDFRNHINLVTVWFSVKTEPNRTMLIPSCYEYFSRESVTNECAMAEVTKHPRVMLKIQKELDSVVGLNIMVLESNLSQLNYLQCHP